ncbi:hypothetical protein ACIBCN_18265 [Nocardia sp. NPDC051052]|uniref:hypothetical protein n=1 Tax=Nocardia sp. NPDC051052 TaxID=3364322 RepID=UPI0037B0A363
MRRDRPRVVVLVLACSALLLSGVGVAGAEDVGGQAPGARSVEQPTHQALIHQARQRAASARDRAESAGRAATPSTKTDRKAKAGSPRDTIHTGIDSATKAADAASSAATAAQAAADAAHAALSAVLATEDATNSFLGAFEADRAARAADKAAAAPENVELANAAAAAENRAVKATTRQTEVAVPPITPLPAAHSPSSRGR